MKGLFPLLIGLFGTFAFSWLGLTVVPNFQIGHLDPQSDEDGTDIYPMPKSGMVERGRHVYVANGCIYCHSQQIRPGYEAADIDRKWGERRSAPRDYIFDRPVQLGKERMGPDLSNLGKRAPAEESAPTTASAPTNAPSATTAANPAASSPPPPPNASPAGPAVSNVAGEPLPYSAAWHHKHLYSPRSVSPDFRDSNMPAFKFLYEKRLIEGERSADALQLTGAEAPPSGWEIVPTYDATCLVAYLMSLDQSHPLKEVKSSGSPAASAAASAAPPKGAK
ncbi:MAG TPA: cbb3-type cytochrome c oxidase subunit II [Chthoniobacterales bacterium]|nr:cbb3-type cytochrome c oxidase subunit II [Chthoniobacterales bacterium]